MFTNLCLTVLTAYYLEPGQVYLNLFTINHTPKILICELAKPELNFDIHTNLLKEWVRAYYAAMSINWQVNVNQRNLDYFVKAITI